VNQVTGSTHRSVTDIVLRSAGLFPAFNVTKGGLHVNKLFLFDAGQHFGVWHIKEGDGIPLLDFLGYVLDNVRIQVIDNVRIQVIDNVRIQVLDNVRIQVIDNVRIQVLDNVRIQVIDNVRIQVIDNVRIQVIDNVRIQVIDNVRIQVIDNVRIQVIDNVRVYVPPHREGRANLPLDDFFLLL
jgi:hypothetical protein